MEKKIIQDITILSYTVAMEQCGNRFACHILEYDLYFSARDEESAKKKGEAMVKMYIEHLHEMNKPN